MNYFFDCGSDTFQGLMHFDKIYNFDENWTIFSFEANPYVDIRRRQFIADDIYVTPFFNKLKSKINLINAAVSDTNGFAVIHCQYNKSTQTFTEQGSNILQNPPAFDPLYKLEMNYTDEIVLSVCLSNIIASLGKMPEAKIHIKLDVEGAEYAILDKIIREKSYAYIHEIFIEFHHRFFSDEEQIYKQRNIDIINFLRAQNVIIHDIS